MLLRTHLAFAIFMILLFLNFVSNKLVFIIMVLVATIIPDLDTNRSHYGRNPVFAPLQAITSHRGFIHSFTTAFVLAAITAIWWPIASFGFFIGYSIHLIMDSFTREGIQPFWPFKWVSNGPVRTGGKIEEILFIGVVIIDILLFFINVIYV